MNAHGTLLSADSIRIQSDSTAHNSGTIAGRRAVQIAALDIDNIGGRIVADTVSLQAQRDINVIGGSVSAALALLAQAGNDINVQTTTRSSSGGTGANGYANTVIDQVAALSVTGTSNATESTTLALQAGRDITLQAAQITNTATNGATQISAGHNLNLETVGTAREQRITWDSRNHLFFGNSQEVGTQIDTQGSTLLAAGNDITARATQVQSAADARLQAGGDIHIATGQTSQWLDDAYYIQSSGLLGSSSETWINKVHTTEAQASSIGAETIQISAGRNLEVTGSNVVSDKGTALQAGQDITIAAASNTHNALHFNEERRSGVFSNGGIGFTVGSQMQSTDQRGQQTSAAASTVGSIEGSVSIQAGQNYRQIGSDVLAPKGDIAIAAKDIAITEAEQTHNSEQHTRFKQSGISVSIGSPIISMAQTAQGMAQAASNTSDTRMQALAAGAAALNVSNNQDALQALASGNPAAGASISISVGSSQSRSDSYQSASTSQGSHVQASGDVQITATGAGQNSNLTIQGSDITAGNNANLTADNDITLLASTDTHSERSSNKSSSGAIGIAIGQGGIGITASASRGKGYANSDDTAYNNTHITAGNTASLQSGNDTQLKGAVVSAEQVTANVGGNLNIQSLQDSSTFDGKQQNIGGSITVGAGFSASVSYSNSKASGNYASVTEQSGIQAGDNGFQIHVQGNTDLQGATIASTQEAIENDRNSLRTGTLTSSDIANRSNYKASGINLSGGFTVAGNNPADQSTGTSSTVDNGENWSWQNFNKTGTSGAAAGVSSDKGNTQSTTTSSISAGQFTMTDAEGQQQKTGQSAAQMVASIDRTAITGDSASGLEKTWNGQQLLQAQTANAQIIATFGQQASKAIGDYAAQKLQEAQAAQDQAGIDAWKEGGTARIALHALIGGLTGGVQGALGAGAASAAAPAIEQLQEQFQSALQNAGLGENTAKTLASLTGGATAATIGAAASGGTAAGAAGGFNADMNNRQLHPNERKRIKELAKEKAEQLCQGDIHCTTQAALYWTDMLERAAEGRVDTQEAIANQAYYQKIILAAEKPGSEAFMGAAEYFFNDLNQALLILNANAGNPILDDYGNVVLGTDGKPQTYFSATQAQRDNPYDNIFPGGSPNTQTSVIPGKGNRDQDRLDRLNTPNGQATPDTTLEEILIGVRLPVKGSNAVVKVTERNVATALPGTAKSAEEALLRSGGAFDKAGNPLLDMSALTNNQKGLIGDLFGTNLTKQIVPDGQKIARMQGVGTNGIDDLYRVNRPDVDYVFIEYKFVGQDNKTGAQVLKNTKDGLQGSEAWISGSKRIDNAVEKNLVPDIHKAIDNNRIESWVITTRPDGSTLVQVLDSMAKPKPIDQSKIIIPNINFSGTTP